MQRPLPYRRPAFFASLIALSATLLIAGCAAPGPKVRSDFNRTTDFSTYRTFGFPAQTGTDRGGYSTLITSYFKEALQREMTARGYTYTTTEPDLLVNFYTETREKTQVYSQPFSGPSYYPYWGVRYGRPRYGFYSAWPFYSQEIDAVQYTTGTIKVDVVDAKRQQTIWEASAEERLTETVQDNPQPNISRLVTELFRKFPRSVSSANEPLTK